jgi:predicted N-formylglutamate amidohydrolase
MNPALVFTCEHAGRIVPANLAPLFRGHHNLLASHRGYDPGIAPVAEVIAAAYGVSLLRHDISRLIVDVNRSPRHPNAFSEITRPLPPAVRRTLRDRYHTPHRTAVEQAVREARKTSDAVVHIGWHSFTPVLNGLVRRADIGVLYDPARAYERRLAALLVTALKAEFPAWTIRRNSPYRGTADGLTTTLRRQWPDRRYAGLEVEINQKHLAGPADRKAVRAGVIRALARVLPPTPTPPARTPGRTGK